MHLKYDAFFIYNNLFSYNIYINYNHLQKSE